MDGNKFKLGDGIAVFCIVVTLLVIMLFTTQRLEHACGIVTYTLDGGMQKVHTNHLDVLVTTQSEYCAVFQPAEGSKCWKTDEVKDLHVGQRITGLVEVNRYTGRIMQVVGLYDFGGPCSISK